jgi:TonB-linked SusC/RagA family outer membrane protein
MNKRYYLAAVICFALLSLGHSTTVHAAQLPVVEQAKGHILKGTVLDEQGQPIIGATIMQKGTKKATVTDLDGHFLLTGVTGPVVVSYLGYKDQVIKPTDDDITVNMKEDAGQLDEVVVTGYGTQKKASLTSAISQIKGDEVFKDRSVSSTAVALQGEIPGLTVTRSSTRPGSEGASMQIRGDISINGGGPLIIIDGLTGSIDELNAIDGNDIENISVLKDASAAIYGSRAAGGVILVTTKRGKKGNAQITYNGSISRTINGIQAPLTSNKEWLDMFYEAQYNDAAALTGLTDHDAIHQKINWWIFNSFGGVTTDPNDVDENGNPRSYVGESLFNALRDGKTLTLKRNQYIDRWDPNSYMMDYLYGQATSQKHNLSISGADDHFGYRLSLGYESDRSQLKPAYDGQKKWSARFNGDYQATDRLKLQTSISFERRKVQSPSTDVGAGWFDPWFWAVVNENGDAYDTFSGVRNPIGGLTQGGTYTNELTTFRGSVQGNYDLGFITKGLSLTGSAAFKRVEKNEQTQKNGVTYYDWVGTVYNTKQFPSSLSESFNRWDNITLDGFVNYSNTFAERHKVYAQFGMTAEQETNKAISASRNKGEMFPNSGLKDLDVYIGGDNNGAGGGQYSYGLVSYVTRLNYSYNDTYSLEFIGRRDGSSKLSKSQRWKNFYSLSGYWRLTSEPWMKDIKWLNDLKLRYNYGKTGSVTGIGNYERFAGVSTGQVLFGVNPAWEPSLWVGGMTSDNRTWETINSHNIGLDFTMLGNRLSGSFDYFIKTNSDMFISVEYPTVLGATAPKVNDGKFRARGWELALNWRDKIGEVKYNLGFNLSDVWSKVLKLTQNADKPYPGINKNRIVGKPRNAIYVYQTDGIFQNQEEVDAYYEMYYWNADHTGPKSGNILPVPSKSATNTLRPGARRLVDVNGDGKITVDDICYAGDTSPRMTFGIKAGLEWKGIDFSVFFQGVGKQKILRSGNLYAPWVTNYMLQNKTFAGKMWTPENTNAEYCIASRDQNFNKWNYMNKDVSVQNNRYIRLKSLVLGYTLPKSWVRKATLENVRFYFSGDDLWEWTKVKDGYDPEYGENTNNTFPFSRLLTFGVNVTF